MNSDISSSQFSKKALEALQQNLDLHRAMIWVDPANNQLAVKRITPVAESKLETQRPMNA